MSLNIVIDSKIYYLILQGRVRIRYVYSLFTFFFNDISSYSYTRTMLAGQGFHGDLTSKERKIMLAAFMLRHKAHSASVIEQLLSQRKVSLGQRTGNAYEMFLARQVQIIASEDRNTSLDPAL